MKKFVVPAEAAAALVVVSVGLAPIAAADSADAVVSNLESQGYNVQYKPPVPRSQLPQCSAAGIRPSSLDPSASLQEKQHTLVEVDVLCPAS